MALQKIFSRSKLSVNLVVLLTVIGAVAGFAWLWGSKDSADATATPVDAHASVVGGFDSSTGCQATLPAAFGFDVPTDRAAFPPRGLSVRASDLSESPPEPFAWYGSPELWTVLDRDGVFTERNSFWWSINFPGGRFEEQPDISVVAQRLDQAAAPIRSESLGTNAFTAISGWLMIADFPFTPPPGCWVVTGTYKGASLTFVLDIP